MEPLVLLALASVVLLIIGRWTFGNRRGSGGTTVIVDNIAIGLTGAEL